MAHDSFKTNPVSLKKLLERCQSGELQLPDFQRSWVWDEERIRSLVASVSRGFPIGALMTLETGGDTNFKPRAVEGAAASVVPTELLLDGQQRMTSLFQVTVRRHVVETITPKKRPIRVWFYFDINKALNDDDREAAILTVPEDRKVKANFDRDIVLDLSTRTAEFENMMYPVTEVFDFGKWSTDFVTTQMGSPDFNERWQIFNRFKDEVLTSFETYAVPVITLDKATSKEAVCTVFEKVNTGGKPLDTFELLTAIYASDGHELRRDWLGLDGEVGRQERLKTAHHLAGSKTGILADVKSTDFLQVVALFHTREERRAAEHAGRARKELPQVSVARKALLNLPLAAYRKYEARAENGFISAAKFLHKLHIYRPYDLPYQSQIVPLAAILADIGDEIEHTPVREKLEQWYWAGVFGELYGSTTENRIAKDFIEVPAWIGGAVNAPTTVVECTFRLQRLNTMRSRLSAAYKGVNALLMNAGAEDFRSGQRFEHTAFFDEGVDIHHIFPQNWSAKAGIDRADYDSIVNKTPLSYRTNRIIGGDAPSAYLAKLEGDSRSGKGVPAAALDRHLRTHLIDPGFLRADRFTEFFDARRDALAGLIESAVGKKVVRDTVLTGEADDVGDSDVGAGD